jgi:hypothetical protein
MRGRARAGASERRRTWARARAGAPLRVQVHVYAHTHTCLPVCARTCPCASASVGSHVKNLGEIFRKFRNRIEEFLFLNHTRLRGQARRRASVGSQVGARASMGVGRSAPLGERERTLASASASLWVKFLWKFGSLLASEGGYRRGLAGGTKFNVKTIRPKFPSGNLRK